MNGLGYIDITGGILCFKGALNIHGSFYPGAEPAKLRAMRKRGLSEVALGVGIIACKYGMSKIDFGSEIFDRLKRKSIEILLTNLSMGGAALAGLGLFAISSSFQAGDQRQNSLRFIAGIGVTAIGLAAIATRVHFLSN